MSVSVVIELYLEVTAFKLHILTKLYFILFIHMKEFYLATIINDLYT